MQKTFSSLFRLVAFNKNFCSTYCTRKLSSEEKRIRAKVIPTDIWDEEKDSKFTSTEEVSDHWHFVERLFPKLKIPIPPKTSSAVGWKAPADKVPDLPYFIERTRNHMLPVYEDHVYKERVLITKVAKVQGDIYVFEYDMKSYLEKKLGEKIESHVNEICCHVNFKGKHVDIIKQWLYDKGF